MCVWNAKGQVCNKQSGLVAWPHDLVLVAWPHDLTKSWVNCLARLEVLSYNALAGVTLQLPCMLHTCASFGNSPAASQSRDPVARPCWVHTLKLFFTLSHTLPLHDFHLNTGFLNAKLQANWHRIKPTKWLIKFNLTSTNQMFRKSLTLQFFLKFY